MKSFLLLVSSILLFSCNHIFDPIDYGKDACTYCKMTIVDKRYAAELIDKNGKTFKFDDVGCMVHYIAENNLNQSDLKLFVADYLQHSDNFLIARDAKYIHNEFFKSPMKGNTGAFANPEEASNLSDSLHSNVISWNELKF